MRQRAQRTTRELLSPTFEPARFHSAFYCRVVDGGLSAKAYCQVTTLSSRRFAHRGTCLRHERGACAVSVDRIAVEIFPYTVSACETCHLTPRVDVQLRPMAFLECLDVLVVDASRMAGIGGL